MKKSFQIQYLLAVMLIAIWLFPCRAYAGTECNVQPAPISYTDAKGNTVTNATLVGKPTFILYSHDACNLTQQFCLNVMRSVWFPGEHFHFMVCLFSHEDGNNMSAESLQEYISNYCGDDMIVCNVTDSEMFNQFHQVGEEGNSMATPMLLILDEDGYVRYYDFGYKKSSEIDELFSKYADLSFSMDDEDVDLSVDAGPFSYTGKEIKPTVNMSRGKNAKLLYKGTNFNVTYENNVNAGTGYINITGGTFLTGSKRIPFTITPKSLEGAYVGDIDDQTFNGQEIKPAVKLTLSGKELVNGTDFTVTYKDNINPGTASISIQGLGNYSGSVSKSFVIKPAPIPEQKEEVVTSFVVNNQKYSVIGDGNVEYQGENVNNKKTVKIPKYVNYLGVKYKVTRIASKSFRMNKKVTVVKIESYITDLGDSCFEGCSALKSVTIGTGLRYIGKNAFKNCKKLKSIKIKSAKLKSVGKGALKGVHAKCRIGVPKKQVKNYKKLFKGKGQKKSVKVVKG